MIFPSGTKVRLRFTGETGTITIPLGDGMVQVRMDADTSSLIPAFEEDLLPLTAINKFAPTAPKSAGPPPRRVIKKSVAPAYAGKGIQLIFEPMPGADEMITRYKTWLYNDTPHEFLFELGIFIGEESILKLDGKLSPFSIYEASDLLSDDLNDNPEAELSVRRITTAGAADEIFKILKIKTKAFVKNFEYLDILNLPVHYFTMVEQFEPTAETGNKKEDLSLYAKQKISEIKKKEPDRSNSVKFDAFNVEAFAHFEPEIDLHIQALIPGHVRLDKGEILRIQMNHLERFMERAIRLGVSRVFIIHGVGEGKLREHVAVRLRDMHRVRKFKNEYHQKYGYGATEVWLD
jgi:hypothetical protein